MDETPNNDGQELSLHNNQPGALGEIRGLKDRSQELAWHGSPSWRIGIGGGDGNGIGLGYRDLPPDVTPTGDTVLAAVTVPETVPALEGAGVMPREGGWCWGPGGGSGWWWEYPSMGDFGDFPGPENGVWGQAGRLYIS